MTTLKKVMKLPVFTLFVYLGIYQKSFSQSNLTGKWMDKEHNEKKIEMYIGADKKIYGKSKKGTIVFKSFVYDTETKFYNGILINPADNQEFNIIIKQLTADNFTFSVKKLIFSKKFIFIRQL